MKSVAFIYFFEDVLIDIASLYKTRVPSLHYMMTLMWIRQPFALAFLGMFADGTNHPAHSTEIFLEPEVDASSCTTTSGSIDLFSTYLASTDFLEEAKRQKLPDDQYFMLVSRFVWGYQGNFNLDDAVFEAILEGTYSVTSTSTVQVQETEDTSAELLAGSSEAAVVAIGDGPHRRSPVPIRSDDIIVTNAVPDLIKVRNDIEGMAPQINDDWYITLSAKVNTELYLVYNQVEQASSCDSLQCRIWREVLKQLHLRVAVGFASKEWPDCYFFSGQVSPVLQGLISEGLRSRAHHDQPKFCMVAAAIVLPIVIEASVTVGCWCLGRCMKWYRESHETTTEAPTTTPEPPTTVDPMIGIRREHRKIFFKSASAYLDEVVGLVGSVDEKGEVSEFEAKLAEVRKIVIWRIMEIATGMSKMAGEVDSNISDFDVSKAKKLAFEVNSVMSQYITPTNWLIIRANLSQYVTELRTELINLLIQLV